MRIRSLLKEISPLRIGLQFHLLFINDSQPTAKTLLCQFFQLMITFNSVILRDEKEV